MIALGNSLSPTKNVIDARTGAIAVPFTVGNPNNTILITGIGECCFFINGKV